MHCGINKAYASKLSPDLRKLDDSRRNTTDEHSDVPRRKSVQLEVMLCHTCFSFRALARSDKK